MPVVLLLVSEEEIGSPVSRPVTERIARECRAAFVMEPAQGLQGAYKTARKGIADYRLQVRGVAAHSGVDFEKGHSAVLELMRLLAKVEKFTDLKSGLTVNPGVIGGGTRSNVVAAEAWADVDVRIAKASDAKRVEKMFHGLQVQRQALRADGDGWDESSADGAQDRHDRVVQARAKDRAGDGIEAGRGFDGRRVGRELYRKRGDTDAGWDGAGGRRGACGA